MIDERSLPNGDRDDFEPALPNELPSEYVTRLNAEPAGKPETCLCRARGWQCRHEEPFEVRVDRIMRGEMDGRKPGQEG